MLYYGIRNIAKRMGLIFVVIGLVGPVFAAGISPESIPWTRSHYAELRSLFPTAASVEAFIKMVVAENKLEDEIDIEFNPPVVLDYDFIDLTGDSRLELISRLDFSGRDMPLYLLVISRVDDHFQVSLFHFNGMLGKIVESVKDIDNNGQKEVIVKTPLLSQKNRITPTPYFYHIYQYKDNKFILEDNRFKSYYQTVLLPSLERELYGGRGVLELLRQAGPAAMPYLQEKENAIRGSIAAIQEFLRK